jgi:hypothetical protein
MASICPTIGTKMRTDSVIKVREHAKAVQPDQANNQS